MRLSLGGIGGGGWEGVEKLVRVQRELSKSSRSELSVSGDKVTLTNDSSSSSSVRFRFSSSFQVV